MAQFGRTLSFGSSGRFKFRLPVVSPRVEDDHAVNWRGLKEQWDALPLPYRFGCSVRATANQSIAVNTSTQVTWDTAVYDDNHFWKLPSGLYASGSASVLQVPPGGSGLYMVFGYVLWDTGSNVLGPQLLPMRAEAPYSTQLPLVTSSDNAAATVAQKMFVCVPAILNDGDRIALNVFHSSAAARNIVYTAGDTTTNAFSPQFSLWRFAIFG